MRVEAKDGSSERRFLIASVLSTPFLSRVAGRLEKDPLRGKWSNMVFSWCRENYIKYASAPNGNIQGIYEQWAAKNTDKDIKSTIERFLSSLSDEYENGDGSIDVEFTIDLSEKLLNEVKLERLQEELEGHRDRGNIELALQAQQNFRRLNLRSAPFVDVLNDEEAYRAALEDKATVLIRMPGAAGDFFGNELAEDSFVAFMAAAKGGKSHVLLDLAWRAMRQGRKVAYFQIGDLSKNQIMRRFLQRAARHPLHAKSIMYPISIMLQENEPLAVVEHDYRVFEQDLDLETAKTAFEKAKKKSKTGDIRLRCYPVKSVSINDIKNDLERWDEEGWNARCVILDYMGNLAATDAKLNPVDQVSYTWAIARQITQTRNCLFLTAQQSNKEGFRAYVLTRNHFSDSKMILAHVTAFLGINMTEEERYRHIVRYNFAVRREDEFQETLCLHAASCLDVKDPMVLSALPERRRQ